MLEPVPEWPRRGPAAAPSLAVAVEKSLGAFHLTVDLASRRPRVALLGPSGSGKSVTLKLLAGLLAPDAGRIAFGDAVWFGRGRWVPPEGRRVGYVPQEDALFPHLTVAQNLAYSLRVPGAERDRRVAWWAARLGLGGLEHRYPHQLSGGQRRRVALGRALLSEPQILLLDEPFSGVDAPMRWDLRRLVRGLQDDLGIPTVLVTHDPEEAALLADEVWVLVNGRIVQGGTLEEVFSRPATPTVARLIGIPNVLPGRATGNGTVAVGPLRVPAGDADLPPGGAVLCCVHPEAITLLPAAAAACGQASPETVGATGTVRAVLPLGAVQEVDVSLAGTGGLHLVARGPAAAFAGLAPGQGCHVVLSPGAVHVFPLPDQGEGGDRDRRPQP